MRMTMPPKAKFLIVNFIMLASVIWAVGLYVMTLFKTDAKAVRMLPHRKYVVPNVVHFIRFGSAPLSFIDAICMMSALKNQKPDILMVHSDQKNFNGGKYWLLVQAFPKTGVVEIKHIPSSEGYPDYISVNKGNSHRSEIEKLKILSKYGGIYVDNDIYIVKSLNMLRRYEFTLPKGTHKRVTSHLIIADEHALFLKEWMHTFKTDGDQGYYNKGIIKLDDTIINRPYLIHWMKDFLGDFEGVRDGVYLGKSTTWRSYSAIHLLNDQQYLIPRNLSHQATYPVVFNETNIHHYDATIKDMVMDVYYPVKGKLETSRKKSKNQR